MASILFNHCVFVLDNRLISFCLFIRSCKMYLIDNRLSYCFEIVLWTKHRVSSHSIIELKNKYTVWSKTTILPDSNLFFFTLGWFPLEQLRDRFDPALRGISMHEPLSTNTIRRLSSCVYTLHIKYIDTQLFLLLSGGLGGGARGELKR